MRVRSWKGLAAATAVATAITGTIIAQAGADEPNRGADIRVDANRDGRVDISGTSDETGEDSWAADHGAVLLPNVDDDAKRCPVKDAQGKPLSDTKLARCHDGADEVVNGAADAKDLARVRTMPQADVSSGTRGTVKVEGAAAKHTRLFVKRSGAWKPLPQDGRLTKAELRSGAELGIEARDVVRDAKKWDGTVTVRMTVTQGSASTTDQVTMRVAPVLTHHHLQRVEEVLVSEVAGEHDRGEVLEAQWRFVQDLQKEVKKAGISKPVRKFTEYDDLWAQDFVEPAYTSMPGANGKPQTMRVMIRSPQPKREAGRELFEKLRGPNVGVIQFSGIRNDEEEVTLNSMGNLETIPPYSHNDKDFPAGRIIQGHRPDSGSKPAKALQTFLSAQKDQSPLFLDTSWLGVGHVDEFVQFLPADTERGWRIAVADPDAGVELLRKAKREGHGDTRMFSVPDSGEIPAPKEKIDKVLSSQNFLNDNKLAAKRIAGNLEILKRETGVTDKEIVRVPGLFTGSSGDELDESEDVSDSRELRRLGPDALREYSQLPNGNDEERSGTTPKTSAYVPGAVNGLVLSDTYYLAPKQWGPVIGGKDVFTEAVTAAYRNAGFTTAYIDDWYSHHFGSGEVHCGTNTLRDPSSPWWSK